MPISVPRDLCALEPSRRLVNTARPKGGPGPWCPGHIGARGGPGLGAPPGPATRSPRRASTLNARLGAAGPGARRGVWGLQVPALQVQSESHDGPAV